MLALTGPGGFGDFVGLPATSRPQREHGLALTDEDLVRGALPLRSWIRTDRPVTLRASLVVKTVARVSEPVVAEAVRRFCALLNGRN